VRVQFLDGEGGTTVGHDAKAVKGILARTLLTEGLDALSTFEWQGWRSVMAEGTFQIVSPSQRNLDGWVTKRKRHDSYSSENDLGTDLPDIPGAADK